MTEETQIVYRYGAVIEDGIVTNIIVLSPDADDEMAAFFGAQLIPADAFDEYGGLQVWIGDGYADGEYIDNHVDTDVVIEPTDEEIQAMLDALGADETPT
jgi:hypothetical protein